MTMFGRNQIHTSDRILFKRCRRKWNWASPLRENLIPKDASPSALWFGTGFHFALEDFHGYNRFGDPVKAFEAYYDACRPSERPEDADELLDLARGMLSYYQIWLRHRNEFQTYWVDGVPQVEVDFEIPLPPEICELAGREIVYAGTFDRVVVDPYGRLWIMDYKTVKQFDTSKLETDPQISAYAWAAELIYEREVEGVVYMQFYKGYPQEPKVLQNGTLSKNKNQRTTHALYRRALLRIYGSPDRFPPDYVEFLNYLLDQESAEGDKFIRRDLVRRNGYSKETEYKKILDEVMDMLDPNLRIYPNPTRDCIWDCPFRSACLAMDDGSDWEYIIENDFMVREEVPQNWRQRIQWPQ